MRPSRSLSLDGACPIDVSPSATLSASGPLGSEMPAARSMVRRKRCFTGALRSGGTQRSVIVQGRSGSSAQSIPSCVALPLGALGCATLSAPSSRSSGGTQRMGTSADASIADVLAERTAMCRIESAPQCDWPSWCAEFQVH
eukprot:scaffold63172_cov27-Tisochrysis_lutea.AAC.6